MNKQKNKVLKVSMATLALLVSTGYVANNYQVLPAHADSVQFNETTSLINTSTSWKYLDNNVDPGTQEDRYAWTKAEYLDTEWKNAAGKFGAKNGELASLGGDFMPTVLLNQYIEGTSEDIPAFFFRTTVNINSLDDLSSITGSLYYDDAAIVYLNGIKVASFDEPAEGFESNLSYGGSNAGTPKEGEINLTNEQLKDVLKTGKNIIAVELHQGRASSSDVYFEFADLQVNYGVVEVEQKALNLTVGEDETKMNLTWYANSPQTGTVQLAKAGSMINGQFPTEFITINAASNQSNDNGFYYNQATLTNLEENTKYVYRIVNGDKVSQVYDFTTKDFDGSFNFILAGDPQIGASGNADNDTAGWGKTLEDSAAKFNPNFILSAGDQVNTASNETQYSGYLEHEELTSIPQATTVGNHDSGSNAYSQHYNLPNITGKGATTAGSDYWYVYNNTLFMNINTNNTSTAEHQAFMEEAIAANPDVRWKVVVFHHSIYSVASHAVENSILKRREELTPVFDKLGIDVVLMGHDHVYVRSNIMKGMQVVTDTSALESITDPDGILYVTANSASGSKYYNIKTDISTEFVAKMDQSKQRSISNIEVNNNQFKVTTYLYDANSNDWAVIDTFTINKTQVETDKTFLKIAIEEADKITQEHLDSLVPVVAKEFKEALDNAKEVFNNSNATQEQINDAGTRLAYIMHYLDFKKGDKEALQNLVTTIDKLDQTKYSQQSWQAMLPVLKEAKQVLANENALQNEIEEVQESLIKAYLNLRLIPNKDILEDLIKQAESLKQENYSKASWDLLQNTLKSARAILTDENATEAQINQIQTTLSNLLISMEPTTDKSENLGSSQSPMPLKTTTKDSSKVATGDNNDLLAYGTLLFTALGCTVVVLKTRKNNQKD